MSQYRTGTASVINSSNVITGTGTLWSSNIKVDQWFIGPDKIKYNISAVNSDTEIEISVPYGGASLSGQSYVIHQYFIDGKPLFENGDVETAAIINAWVTGTPTTSDAEIDLLSSIPPQADFEAVAEANRRKFAGSGFVEWGKHHNNLPHINEGIWQDASLPNGLPFGRGVNSEAGTSLTNFPIINVNGVICSIEGLADSGSDIREVFKLPPASDGLDKADGTGRFTDLAEAIAAGGTALNASVLNRQDLLGFEFWYEDVETNDAVYPLGNVQYGVSTYEGISLSNTVVAQTYSAFGEWDTVTQGYGLKWSTATEAEKLAFINAKENNIYRDAETGKTIQVRYRARAITGLGPEWANVEVLNATVSTSTDGMLSYGNTGFENLVACRGSRTSVTDLKGTSLSNDYYYVKKGFGGYGIESSDDMALWQAIRRNNGWYAADDGLAHDGKCFFIPIATVDRRNQGAYHWQLNKNGTGYWENSTFPGAQTSGSLWYHQYANKQDQKTISDCFDTGKARIPAGGINWGGISVGLSGREDGKFYDAIYEGDVNDLRISARRKSQGDILEEYNRDSIADEMRGFESESFWEVAGVVIEGFSTNGSAGEFSNGGELSTSDNGNVVVIHTSTNVFVSGYSYTSGGQTELYNTRSGALSQLASEKVLFSRTNGATTTIYRAKDTLKFKEMLQCDIIGDPASYFSGQTFTNTGVSQVVNVTGDDVILVTDSTPVGGSITGHYYRRASGAATVSLDLSTQDYSGTGSWADLGTTYDGQTWTNDGTTQTVNLVTEDVVYVTDSTPVGGTQTGHYYRRFAGNTTFDLSLIDYTPSAWADLGRKYRGQTWTNNGTSQVVATLSVGDVVFNNGSSSGGVIGNFYQRINSFAYNYDLSTTDYTVDFTDLGPDWNESPAAGSWLQDGLGGFPLLTHADTGASLIPDGTSKEYKMSRKVSDAVLFIYSSDNGITWTVDNSFLPLMEGAANGFTSLLTGGVLFLAFYTTDARFTEETNNAVVDMLKNVVYGTKDQYAFDGNILLSSLIGKVATGDADPRESFSVLESYRTHFDSGVQETRLSVSGANKPTHKMLELDNPNGSPATKILSYLTHENGRYYLQFLFKELYWDTTADSWADSGNKTVDATAKTFNVGDVCLVSESASALNGMYVLCTQATSLAESLVNWVAQPDGSITQDTGTVSSKFRVWDGTGWGDDKQFDVINGTDAVTDLNGNNVVVGQARVALPYLTGKDD